MPRAAGLLRLYPRAWRERYGEEFLATAGNGALRPQVVFDIVLGAIDAWLSADIRDATRAYRVATNGGGLPMLKSMMTCGSASSRMTTRDGLVGASVILVTTLLFSAVGIAAKRAGWPVTGEILKSLAFTGPIVISMPFWVMKGQPWKAQAVIMGGTLLILVAASWIATRI